jgi:hypothetical protein
MDILEAEKIIEQSFDDGEVESIEDYTDYFVIYLKGSSKGDFDSVHMLNKLTKELRPFNPTLIQQGEPK